MRKLLLTGAVVAGAGVAMVGSAGAATHHNCGNISQNVGNIRATNTNCATARKVAKADNQGKHTQGWKCTYKQYQGGSTATCTHKGNERVTYQTAD